MSEFLEILEKPTAKEIFIIAGWRQWADAGSISSGLPQYLIQHTGARRIGSISPDGFYIFQIPGTHDMVRPLVKFKNGFPEFLESERNEFFYTGDENKGLIIFLGDEPHMDVERYVAAILQAAKEWNVRRIIGLGGVYGELPYDKERMVSSIYSQENLKTELDQMGVNLSEYQGGASIGSYLCRRAADQGLEYVSFYGFVPTYDFSDATQNINGITIENDFAAWLGIMQRVTHMLKFEVDLSDLEEKSEHLKKLMNEKIDEIENTAPELNIREYIQRLGDKFEENLFQPLEDFWEEELGRLFDKIDPDDNDKT
ncbi:MAG: PAC2 family protein [Anaerolineales bacterium]|nr:PAC2 family protein [Anaerolineales bacterium]